MTKTAANPTCQHGLKHTKVDSSLLFNMFTILVCKAFCNFMAMHKNYTEFISHLHSE